MSAKITQGPWYFNQSVDLEKWLPCITSSPLEGQDNPAYKDESGLVCAFDPQYPPNEPDARVLLSAHDLLLAAERVIEAQKGPPGSSEGAEAISALSAAVQRARGISTCKTCGSACGTGEIHCPECGAKLPYGGYTVPGPVRT